MPLQSLASIPLGLPDLVLARAVHPEEEFFLSALRLATAAINRLDGLKGLEVVGDVFGQVGQQGWAKADDQVDTLVHTDLAQVTNDGLDVCEIRVVPGSVRDTGIRMRLPSCHMTLSHRKEDSYDAIALYPG